MLPFNRRAIAKGLMKNEACLEMIKIVSFEYFVGLPRGKVDYSYDLCKILIGNVMYNVVPFPFTEVSLKFPCIFFIRGIIFFNPIPLFVFLVLKPTPSSLISNNKTSLSRLQLTLTWVAFAYFKMLCKLS